MNDYTIYSTTTGRVIRTGKTSGDIQSKPQTGESVTAGQLDGDTQYVVSGNTTPRPARDLSALSSASPGVAVTITGLADGAVVTATPENGTAQNDTVGSDGEMEITFATAGKYIVQVSEVFPEQAASIEVEVA